MKWNLSGHVDGEDTHLMTLDEWIYTITWKRLKENLQRLCKSYQHTAGWPSIKFTCNFRILLSLMLCMQASLPMSNVAFAFYEREEQQQNTIFTASFPFIWSFSKSFLGVGLFIWPTNTFHGLILANLNLSMQKGLCCTDNLKWAQFEMSPLHI